MDIFKGKFLEGILPLSTPFALYIKQWMEVDDIL
jgi:hypothetical protein